MISASTSAARGPRFDAPGDGATTFLMACFLAGMLFGANGFLAGRGFDAFVFMQISLRRSHWACD
jgi:hypothetical protein